MENISRLMTEKISLEIEIKNNIMYETIKEVTPIEYIKENINSDSNIYFYTIPEMNNNLLSPLHKLSQRLDTHHHMKNKYSKKTDIKIKNVKFSQDDQYCFIPERNEIKDLNHKLFWSEYDLILFRKNYMYEMKYNKQKII